MVSRQLAAYLEEHPLDFEDAVALAVEVRILPLLEELRRLKTLNGELLDENERMKQMPRQKRIYLGSAVVRVSPSASE